MNFFVAYVIFAQVRDSSNVIRLCKISEFFDDFSKNSGFFKDYLKLEGMESLDYHFWVIKFYIIKFLYEKALTGISNLDRRKFIIMTEVKKNWSIFLIITFQWFITK